MYYGKNKKSRTNRLVKEIINKGTEFEIDKDEQFYFLIGQVTAFIINHAGEKNIGSIVKDNILRNASDKESLKELIILQYERVCGDVTLKYDLPFNRALAAILGWKPEGELNRFKEIFMMGLVTQNFLNQ